MDDGGQTEEEKTCLMEEAQEMNCRSGWSRSFILYNQTEDAAQVLPCVLIICLVALQLEGLTITREAS